MNQNQLNDGRVRTHSLNSSDKKKGSPKSIVKAGDYKITINNNVRSINPFDLMKQLYSIGHNSNLTKEQKEEKLKKIINNYME